MENDQKFLKRDGIDLKEVFRIFAGRKWWFIISAIIVLIFGIIYTFIQPINCVVTYKINIEKDYSNTI